jgi:preprotein translocase subunit SecG
MLSLCLFAMILAVVGVSLLILLQVAKRREMQEKAANEAAENEAIESLVAVNPEALQQITALAFVLSRFFRGWQSGNYRPTPKQHQVTEVYYSRSSPPRKAARGRSKIAAG